MRLSPAGVFVLYPATPAILARALGYSLNGKPGWDRTARFLKGYEPELTNLAVTANPERGRPGMFRARVPDGRSVLVKFWDRSDGANEDIKDIWRSEIRQLQRLAAVPRADDLFVPMMASGSDSEGFYIVLDMGLADPLEIFQTRRRQARTFQASPKLPRNRRLLWSNFLRLAQALELLHSQGSSTTTSILGLS